MKLDLSNKSLRKIETNLIETTCDEYFTNDSIDIVIFDNNSINKLENLDQYTQLKQLSLANNHLVEIRTIAKLHNLKLLNLANNSLMNIDPLKELKSLNWLCVSGNEIKSLDALKLNICLNYIDASDNSITVISDLSNLNELNTLNLNGNLLTTLKQAQTYLPKGLKTLCISNNAIEDLNEISYLAPVDQLESLEFQNNPCVEYKYDRCIDYRPFILNWCVSVIRLDGIEITKKEILKAEWLFSQGKGRYFRPGQHLLLIEYLTKVCPLQIADTSEELRFSRILEKQQSYKIESDKRRSLIFDSSYQQEQTQDLDVNEMRTTSPLLLEQYQTEQQHQQQQQQLNNDSIKSTSNNDIIKTAKSAIMKDSSLAYYSNTDLSVHVAHIHHTNDFLYSNMTTSQQLMHNSRYEDYDSRPIKPLDTNLLQKQLEQYAELTQDELEEIRKKAALHLHNRSKTLQNKQIQNQTNKSTPQQTPRANTASNTSNNHQQGENRLIKARSKTMDSTSISNMMLKLQQQHQPSTKIVPPVVSTQLTKNESKSSRNLFTIQKTTQAHRIKDFKLKTHQHKSLQNLRINEENQANPKKHEFTFQDRCACKIQAAWRGYYVRNCSKEIKEKIDFIKYKRILSHVKYLKSNLNDLLEQHKYFCKLNFEAYNALNIMLKKTKAQEQLQQQHHKTQINHVTESQNSALSKENSELKDKVQRLEEKCKYLEKQLLEASLKQNVDINNVKTANIPQEPQIQPPLRVRLQKVNEKSVALKWDHNASNLQQLSGYRIYINDVLRGAVKATDLKALINGIQEEGEYKITVRAFQDKIESKDSNVVITRVKKKQSSKLHDSTATSTAESDDLSMQTVSTTSAPVNVKQVNTSSSTPKTATALLQTPIIMDKHRPIQSPQFSQQQEQQEKMSPPKRDNKTFVQFMKERFNKSADEILPVNDVTTEQQRSTSKSPIETAIPSPPSRVAFLKPVSPRNKEKFINYKPPISPPREPSPTGQFQQHHQQHQFKMLLNNKLNNITNESVKLLNKHRHSRSVDLSHDETQNKVTNENMPQMKTVDSKVLQQNNKIDEIKQAKFSSSEPNLSVNLTLKSDTSHTNTHNNSNGSNTKLEFVRRSYSFDEDEDEDDEVNGLINGVDLYHNTSSENHFDEMYDDAKLNGHRHHIHNGGSAHKISKI